MHDIPLSDAPDAQGWIKRGSGVEDLPPMPDQEVEQLIDRINTHLDRAARIKANAEAAIKVEEDAAAWLQKAHHPDLKAYLERHRKGKAKFARCLYGVVGTRTTQATLKVADQLQALAWASVALPDAVEEVVRASAVPKEVWQAWKHLDEDGREFWDPKPGFHIEPANETLYVKPVTRAGKETDDE